MSDFYGNDTKRKNDQQPPRQPFQWWLLILGIIIGLGAGILLSSFAAPVATAGNTLTFSSQAIEIQPVTLEAAMGMESIQQATLTAAGNDLFVVATEIIQTATAQAPR